MAKSAFCDEKQQCVDGSDEHKCRALKIKYRTSKSLPILVEFQSTGDITTRSLLSGSGHGDAVCPETHFWCLDKEFCLPVFVRCNGVYDCPGHEDEEDCHTYTCPGFYRCRGSKVCMHSTHICDGWPLCPQLDDELLCSQPCPLQCTCNGLAFFCNKVFAADKHPGLRYLDVTDSGMSVYQLRENHMLIHLRLARCRVESVSNFTFLNLHSLDLSDNLLTEVSGHQLGGMPELTVLFLAGNPFTSLFSVTSGSNFELQNIHTLDLSRVRLPLVVPSLFMVLPNLNTLNLSNSGVDLLQWDSSHLRVSSIQKLDLRGCEIVEFPRDLLPRFLDLQILFADSYKLCCPAVLRPDFDLNFCHSISDVVSSCGRLLGSATYRTTVAVLATLSLLGNVVGATAKMCLGSVWRLPSCDVVLTHLSMADMGMGMYLATLGLADHLLAGHYVWQDDSWRGGAVCRLAGVLALSFRFAATFFTTVLTLDRCLHPFTNQLLCLTPRKLKIVCVLVWAVSFLLMIVPLMSHWVFFEQHALCVPLPHIMDYSLESSYAHGVMVHVNLVMFVLCCVCELIAHVYSKLKTSCTMHKGMFRDDIRFVQRGSLVAGFLYTIACLVPTDSHTERQLAAHTALVYFGFVISCATNPYLYLYGVRVENSKRTKEERLFKIVHTAHIS